MPLSYEIFYRRQLAVPDDWSALPVWDVFLSAFNTSTRLRTVYERVNAKSKFWVVHPEYQFTLADLPPEARLEPKAPDESSFIQEVFQEVAKREGKSLASLSIGVDITGFLRPHLLFMVQYLQRMGVTKFHALYAEPDRYMSKDQTSFSVGDFSEVRPVHGYEGSRNSDTSNDVLIIGMGYDHRMIAEVAEEKDKAQKIQLFGLPPLRADMYQESVLRARKVADVVADPNFAPELRASAPACDPFATATVLHEVTRKLRTQLPITNLYLAPLGTKAQTLGFAVYYLGECIGRDASIIFPFSEGYTPETSTGFYKAWCYTVESQ